MTRPVIQLHRPWAPDPAAETIQVLAAGHGLAPHRSVDLLFRRSAPVTEEAFLAQHGLPARRGLRLHLLPRAGTAAAAAFWARVLRWGVRTGGQGIALARTPRYGLRAARWLPRVVAEVHGLGDPDLPALLACSRAAICNSDGTADGVQRMAPRLPVAVMGNAARGPGPTPTGAGEGIGYVGSLRPGKGLEVLAELARDLPVVVVTPDESAARAMSSSWTVEPALEPARVPVRLARFRCLVVPVGPGRFGEVETCPLKLFDALASGRPVVVADAATLHEGLVPRWVPRYRMGDVTSLREAIDRACASADRFAALRAGVRTWDDRGDELHAFLSEVCP